jgi:hypothetical protein
MSKIEVDAIEPQSGTTLTLGASGDTINLASGATAGFGKVLQVVSAVNDTFASTSSNTYSDTGLTQSITPSATSSKILVIISSSLGNTSDEANSNARIMRGATEIVEYSRVSFSGAGYVNCQNSFVFLDSPSTTSATTYKLQYKTDAGVLRFNDYSGGDPASTITLMEILA